MVGLAASPFPWLLCLVLTQGILAIKRHPRVHHESPDAAAKSDVALHGIAASIERLHRLAVVIRQPLRRDEVEKVQKFASRRDPDGFDDLIFAAIDFKFGEHATETLRVQLAKSVVYRRNRLMYQQRHQKKLENERKDDQHDLSAPAAFSTPDQRLHLQLQQGEATRDSQPSPATEASKTEPSERTYDKPIPRLDQDVREKEPTRGTSSVRSSSRAGSTLYPRPPKVLKGESGTKCQFCLGWLPESDLVNVKWWRYDPSYRSDGIETDCG